ncbi:MAG: CheR family methyltransferase [Microcoleus sp.]
MTQAAIEALLRQKIGLDAMTIGSSTITRAVQRRMADGGLTDINIYLTRLQSSPQELQELIEIVVIPETWFFRDRAPFVFLSNYVISEWWPKNLGKTLRVLSFPCSTGEEPYSIAIALLEAGLSSFNFSIDAADISKVALQVAQQGIYGKNSFRGQNLDFRERYFTNTGDLYHLQEFVKQKVNFIQANIREPNCLIPPNYYDLIFCKNLLIYLDQSSINQTIQLLNTWLKTPGILFLGHSESGQKLPPEFASVRHPLAFAYRKTDMADRASVLVKKDTNKTNISEFVRESKGAESRSNTSPSWPSRFSTSQGKFVGGDASEMLSVRSIAPETANTQPAKADLDTARHLADRGELPEATKLCQTYLSQNPTNADAYVLLGEIYQATGDRFQAEQSFQKATYLQPNHYEALIHLALLKEERGDIRGATILRQRIQRLEK